MAWSLAPQLSYVDATRAVAAAAALVVGIWLGNQLPRPVWTANLVVLASAVALALWSLVERSFARFAHLQETPRLDGPFRYPNALGVLCTLGLLAALWLATRAGSRNARAAARPSPCCSPPSP